MFELENHGPDTFVGTGPRYPWGGLYGGQIVAQSLRAAAASIDAGYQPHSIRAYFIRPGDHTEPVRYEVDRIRNGRSFVTRRVVARQAIGAILNAECSFQTSEISASVQSVSMPEVPGHDSSDNTSFSTHFERCMIDQGEVSGPGRDGAGRVTAWMRVTDVVDDDPFAPHAEGVDGVNPTFLHQCWLAFMSDDLATDAVRAAHATAWHHDDPDLHLPGISLDHTVWFHRPMRADVWHLHDVTCHHYHGSRGLAIGHVFAADGEHVATFAQEVLLREPRT